MLCNPNEEDEFDLEKLDVWAAGIILFEMYF